MTEIYTLCIECEDWISKELKPNAVFGLQTNRTKFICKCGAIHTIEVKLVDFNQQRLEMLMADNRPMGTRPVDRQSFSWLALWSFVIEGKATQKELGQAIRLNDYNEYCKAIDAKEL